MSKTPNQIKTALSVATTDRSNEVHAAAGEVQSILAKAQQSRLDQAQQGECQSIAGSLNAAVHDFGARTQQQAAQIAGTARTLKMVNTIRGVVFILLLIVAFVLLFTKWQVALVIALVTLVCNPIAKAVIRSKSQALASQADQPASHALQIIGRPAQGTQEAHGLAQRADNLYLHTLDHNSLLIEQQRRQMEAMQAQHQEQMSQQQEAMRQQQQAMDRMAQGQQDTNDALYGRPGFLGQVARGYDAAKREQEK